MTESAARHTYEDEAQYKKPSLPLKGGTMAFLLWCMALYLLAYTLLDFGWQQAIGPWNYVILLGGVVVLAVIMRTYQPDMRRYLGSKGAMGDNDPLNRG